MILLNPGPVTLSPGVRAALAGPDLCHREPEYEALAAAIRRRLLGVYGLDPERWAAVLLTGSGTAAVEAMVSSLVPRGARLLVVENGVYGERIAEIARRHGIDLARHTLPWGAAVEAAPLEAALAASGADHVAVVHHETTTGRLNDLAAVAAACEGHGARLLVDAVSSFGGEALDLEGWGITACAASSNKCLHGPPGLAFVVARREALAATAGRSLYLDLATYQRAAEAGAPPFTPAVQTAFALGRALEELEAEGGWRRRRDRYRALAARVRRGLLALGFEPLLPEGASSAVLAAYRLPPGRSYAALHDHLKARGFTVYAGQGGLAGEIVRIAVMGAIGEAEVERLLDHVAEWVHGSVGC